MILATATDGDWDSVAVIAFEIQVRRKLGKRHVLRHAIEFDNNVVELDTSTTGVVAPDEGDKDSHLVGWGIVFGALVVGEFVAPEAAVWTRDMQRLAPGRVFRTALIPGELERDIGGLRAAPDLQRERAFGGCDFHDAREIGKGQDTLPAGRDHRVARANIGAMRGRVWRDSGYLILSIRIKLDTDG